VLPDADVARFAQVLAAFRRRLLVRHGLESVAAGVVVGALAWTIAHWANLRTTPALVGAIVAGTIAALAMHAGRAASRSTRAAADALERARPESRNLFVTAEELIAYPQRAQPWIRERVIRDALQMTAGVQPASTVSLRNPMLLLAAAAVLVAGASIDLPRRGARLVTEAVSRISEGVAAAPRLRVVAAIEPPAYLAIAGETLEDPERLSIPEGSQVRLAISGSDSAWRVRFGESVLRATRVRDETIVEVTPVETGYFAVSSDDGIGEQRRLIPVTVIPDRAPGIKLEEPGRDLLVPDSNRSVRVQAAATDDYGLRELSLRYTKVSGSGEQFEFVEGQLPFDVARTDERQWRGRGEIALNALGLEPGDSLVYRVVARDARPGDAGLASSDTFFVEIAGPGQVPLDGFEMPPDQERFALSQQMIVLKIQRLRAREPKLAGEAVRQQAGDIAVEQRSVRANFIFMMGGHVEDEEEEAAHSHEIQEGRLENTARQEISRAVSHMSHAEQALVAVDTALALKQARLAVEALQRAFGRNRYLLRTLPVRSRIDPSRRLSGKLEEAHDWRRSLPGAQADAQAAATRDLLNDLIDAAPAVAASPRDPSVARTLTQLAERALAVNPGDPTWQQISLRLLDVRTVAASTAASPQLQRALRDAIEPLVAIARQQALPARAASPKTGALLGAWAEEARRR
jgi:hypothetical protein